MISSNVPLFGIFGLGGSIRHELLRGSRFGYDLLSLAKRPEERDVKQVHPTLLNRAVRRP